MGVINRESHWSCLQNKTKSFVIFFGFLSIANSVGAAVLPADRADALYHYYDGGGVDIQGPSILVRKSFKDKVSVSANYYVDNVSSASIDVVTTASAYTEERTESSVGVDYLNDKTLMSLGYTQSDENDFSARSAHFNVSQDFFGDLSTLSIGYSQGWDTVGKRGDTEFSRDNDRRHFRIGFSQILTKNSILGFNWENITDKGYLNNPYRSVRYIDESVPVGYSFQSEVYPSTRTSDAVAIRGMYYLPYHASLKLEYKKFNDTWGIEADTSEISYIHPWQDNWIFEVKLRYYKQTAADFYSDLFERANAKNFMARDKEMSQFASNTFGIGVSYEEDFSETSYFDRYGIHFYLDRIQYKFDNFRDLTHEAAVGFEPLFEYDANVIRFFASIYY